MFAFLEAVHYPYRQYTWWTWLPHALLGLCFLLLGTWVLGRLEFLFQVIGEANCATKPRDGLFKVYFSPMLWHPSYYFSMACLGLVVFLRWRLFNGYPLIVLSKRWSVANGCFPYYFKSSHNTSKHYMKHILLLSGLNALYNGQLMPTLLNGFEWYETSHSLVFLSWVSNCIEVFIAIWTSGRDRLTLCLVAQS